MLVVHPASTCDVCLEGYTGRSESLPHSISCGHVFCLSCLRSLRQHICPLCRSPFEDDEVRRIHVDRYEQYAHERTSTPPVNVEPRSELASDNALGLFNENDVPRAVQLHEKITDLVLKSSSTSGVRGVRELIHEIQDVFSTESPDNHRNLRAAFLLLYRLTELQGRFRHVESHNMDLRSENSRDKQALRDWERKCEDIQRSRARDQETARTVEASLRERLRVEELEWQRKYEYIVEEFSNLRRDIEEERFPPMRQRHQEPPSSADSTQLYFFSENEPSSKSVEGRALGKKASSTFSKEDDAEDMYTNFNPFLFHLSPIPPKITLTESRDGGESEDERATTRGKQQREKSRQRSQGGNGSISRASDSPAALKLSPALKAVPISSISGRSRSDSAPYRLTARDVAKVAKDGVQPEASSSAPSSYVHRDAAAAQHWEQEKAVTVTPTMASPEVLRLYSLLEKPSHTSAPRGAEHDTSPTGRPTLLRSSSFQQPRTHTSASLLSSTQPQSQPRLNTQPSSLSVQVQVQAQAAALSPIQRTPPRPVLPHMHSLYASPRPVPASPQETRVGASGRSAGAAPGSMPRRASVSSREAAAGQVTSPPNGRSAPAGGSPPPVFVPPSSLSFGRPLPVSGRS